MIKLSEACDKEDQTMAKLDVKQSGRLRFLFTADGFCVDEGIEDLAGSVLHWKQQFEENRFAALYQLGFVECPGEFDQAGGFLHQLSDAFFRVLTDQIGRAHV